MRHAATRYVLHHRATKLHHRAIKNTNCNTENVPQHTKLQRACRDLSMHPLAKEYTSMQPFENVMCRCNPLQRMACKRACRHIVVPHRLTWQHSSICDALCSNVATKKSCCSAAYRSALVARALSHQATPKPPSATCLHCIAHVAPLLTPTYTSV